jgi:hypothetical protein
MAAGFDDYLAKPVSQWELLSTLARWLLGAPPLERASRAASRAGEDSGLDEAALEMLRELERGDGQGLFAEILTSYLRTATADVANATRALADGDFAAAAHNLAASSDYLISDEPQPYEWTWKAKVRWCRRRAGGAPESSRD